MLYGELSFLQSHAQPLPLCSLPVQPFAGMSRQSAWPRRQQTTTSLGAPPSNGAGLRGDFLMARPFHSAGVWPCAGCLIDRVKSSPYRKIFAGASITSVPAQGLRKARQRGDAYGTSPHQNTPERTRTPEQNGCPPSHVSCRPPLPRDLHRAGTPDALIDPQNELPHFERPSAAAKNLDSRWRRGDGDGGRGVGRTRGCPRRGPRPYRKGQFPFDTRGAKRPLARARRVFPSRHGLAMDFSLPREHLGLSRHALRSYLAT